MLFVESEWDADGESSILLTELSLKGLKAVTPTGSCSPAEAQKKATANGGFAGFSVNLAAPANKSYKGISDESQENMASMLRIAVWHDILWEERDTIPFPPPLCLGRITLL